MATPKQELNNIMVDMFSMIEDMVIPEGKYIELADMFKCMNINIDKLVEMSNQLKVNKYRHRAVTLRAKKLTEAQKENCPSYMLCNCGRVIKSTIENIHIKSMVHYQGRRNRKYSTKRVSEEIIDFEIKREIKLQNFIINHCNNLYSN